jgi:type 1 glutamine amidotransferase
MKARNVYFQMGHSPLLLESAEFKTMAGNAIIWAAGK